MKVLLKEDVDNIFTMNDGDFRLVERPARMCHRCNGQGEVIIENSGYLKIDNCPECGGTGQA